MASNPNAKYISELKKQAIDRTNKFYDRIHALEQEIGQLKMENESLRNQISGLKDDTEYGFQNFEAKNSLLLE